MHQRRDKILLHPKTLDFVNKDAVASVSFEGSCSLKDSGSNIVVDHLAKAQLNSQATSSMETPNATTLLEKVTSTRGELPQNISSILLLPIIDDFLRNQRNLTMEAFYASLDAEASVLSLSDDTRVVSQLANGMPSEETQEAMKTLQDFLSKDFSVLLGPAEYNTMKATLDYLSNLSAEDGVSVEMRSLIIEVSRQFTQRSWDYSNESRKIEFTTAKLLKADELEVGLEANRTHFGEVMCLENELCSELAYLEERKKELEEQINAIEANISASQSARNTATQRKRELFGEAKMLKAQRDELRKQVPRLRDEREWAKKIQANIRAEWSKLGEKFNKSSS